MRNPKKKGGKKAKDAVGPSLMSMDADGPGAAAAAAAAGDAPAVRQEGGFFEQRRQWQLVLRAAASSYTSVPTLGWTCAPMRAAATCMMQQQRRRWWRQPRQHNTWSRMRAFISPLLFLLLLLPAYPTPPAAAMHTHTGVAARRGPPGRGRGAVL